MNGTQLYSFSSQTGVFFPEIERDIAIDTWICDSFEIVETNVDQVSQARIFCLGEIHGNEKHARNNAALIELLYEENALLLVENDSGENSEQGRYIISPIVVDGWDLSEVTETGKWVKADNLARDPSRYKFRVLGDRLRKLEPQLENHTASVFDVCSTLCALACCQLFSRVFSPCIQCYYSRKADFWFQRDLDLVYDRNLSMNEHIKFGLENHTKIFVIAGSGHFAPFKRSNSPFDYTKVDEGCQATLSFLRAQQIPYVVLIPKD